MYEINKNNSLENQKKNGKRDKFFKNIELMFQYTSKLSKIVNKEILDNYKETYFYLFEKIENNELPVLEDYFGDNILAENIYKNKYFLKDLDGNFLESKVEDVYLRLAAYIACVEKTQEKREEYAKKFYIDLFEGHYLPGGRVIAGAGDLYRLKTLANCFVSLIEEDNIESIYKSAYEAARTYSYGGGIGIDISQLRPRKSKVHNAASNSTGAVSFMDLYSMTTGLIGQAGRRGALMLTIDVKHPDILDFINVKKNSNWATDTIMERLKMSGQFDENQLKTAKLNIIENTQIRFANISIKVSDEFMTCVEEQNKFGENTILVYKKFQKGGKVEGISSDKYNYSYGISNKKIEDYKLLEKFSNIGELNSYLTSNNFGEISKEQLDNTSNRDFYGNFVIGSDSLDYDLAIKYSGDFLTYYKSDSVGEIKELHKARNLWNAFIEGNYKTAEPGLIFWSQMSKYSPSNYVGRPISCTNPCGEVPLEDGGACNLASINLSRMVKKGFTDLAYIDFELIETSVENAVRFLDNVVWWNETLNALEKQRNSASITRRLGLGVMGIADLFLQIGVEYDSLKGIEILEKIMNRIAQKAYKTSALLAKEKGVAPCYNKEQYIRNPFFKEIISKEVQELIKENGMRNIAVLSIAPTGTISNAICGFRTEKKNYIGISGGIEPIFALYYTRRSEQMNQGAIYNIFHNTVQAYFDIKGLTNDVKNMSEEELKKILPKYFFRTAHNIKPEMRIKIQSIAQKYIDHSISSTVNLTEDIEPETISDIYITAWKNKLKGITIYRDGSRYPILAVPGKESEFQRFKDKKFKIKMGDEQIIVNGNEVLVTSEGKLTTIYHGKRDGLFN